MIKQASGDKISSNSVHHKHCHQKYSVPAQTKAEDLHNCTLTFINKHKNDFVMIQQKLKSFLKNSFVYNLDSTNFTHFSLMSKAEICLKREKPLQSKFLKNAMQNQKKTVDQLNSLHILKDDEFGINELHKPFKQIKSDPKKKTVGYCK